MGLHRTGFYGDGSYRNGVLDNLDSRVRSEPMREALIIGFFLITAVLVWTIPRKGGKK